MKALAVTITGLGFTGLPMAIDAVRAGCHVVAVDSSPERVAAIAGGAVADELTTVSDRDLRAMLATGRLHVQTSAHEVPAADVHVLCVPTPPGSHEGVDLAPLRRATRGVAASLRVGDLVVVQSTCPPGVVDDVVATELAEGSGLRVGRDVHLAHSPVRIDPGIASSTLRSIPRIVGGATPRCTKLAARFLRRLTDRVVTVSSIRTAELVKVFENTFRLVNVSLVNELAALCHASGVAVEEVLDAAASKPFGFLRHAPSAGAGGDCVPVCAGFFASAARRCGVAARVVEAAIVRNNAMPSQTVRRLEELVHGVRPLRDCRVLVVGVTYKPDVPNVRQSAAVKVLELLHHQAEVGYHDPYVHRLVLRDGTALHSETLRPGVADLVVILTRHQAVDTALLMRCQAPIVDCTTGLPHFVQNDATAIAC
ncbi:nucleotide sugar dehydrogenase [Kutzneria buriramensis]|uniref:UDP-N-acetyl-D-glucosamine dehydrogenase n=1 Tax=Kutzneria buriramensis TaxID=1045776 RepID=A0A3E0GYU0_9PSEU|nr:nucleotide sugar dehydrogenase [Kutzneria buriramensis]REH35289.1 UDP-N-acetyl-D-glucosamine dehydrogenase [Kutzneria buriramensis]